jgi:hypothetical protein
MCDSKTGKAYKCLDDLLCKDVDPTVTNDQGHAKFKETWEEFKPAEYSNSERQGQVPDITINKTRKSQMNNEGKGSGDNYQANWEYYYDIPAANDIAGKTRHPDAGPSDEEPNEDNKDIQLASLKKELKAVKLWMKHKDL